MQNILIVCMGNVCRSPMAEGLFRQHLEKPGQALHITSAGLTAMVGHAPVTFAQEVMQEKMQIDISSYRAKQATPEMLLTADLILVMEAAQKKKIEYNLPSVYGRVRRLGEWSGFDIPDPHCRSKQVFQQTLLLIEQCLTDWRKRLWK